MTFDVIDVPQGSAEWKRARSGRLTGSRAGDMLARIKSGEAVARRDLRVQLICERLTGEPQEDGYVSAEMQRGTELEPQARAAYEALRGEVVQESGFLAAHERAVGCSLDGHVGSFAGIVEIKCPKSATHFRYLRAGVLPADYVPQVTHNLWVSGAEWCDFLSFDPRFPSHLRACLVRVHRGDLDIAAYQTAADAFLDEVAAELSAVRNWRVLETHPAA